MLKIYRSKKFMSLSVPLCVDGKAATADFKGGSVNPRVCGCFVTMDKGLQDALENEPGFNRDYFLEKSIAPCGGHIGLPAVPDAPCGGHIGLPAAPDALCGGNAGEGPEPHEGVGGADAVCRVQDAAEYLCERYGVKKADVNSKVKIRAFIADKGVVFPNLDLGDGTE